MSAEEDWAAEQRRLWQRKSGLREYYEREIFDRLLAEVDAGPVLQLGTGAGFLSGRRGDFINTDIDPRPGVDVVADAHALAFGDACFAYVVGVDVLHHLAAPGRALAECARVLRPGGSIALVEPWAGTLGRMFYRHLHHEDCAEVADPWTAAFPEGKAPMDGNGYIPYALFAKRADEIGRHAPGLRLTKLEPFGSLSYLLTGGFQAIGFPAPVIRRLADIEARLPRAWRPHLALRVLVVLEKTAR